MPILYEDYMPPVPRKANVKPRGFQAEQEYNLLDASVASPPLPRNIGFGVFTGGTIRKDTYVNVVWDAKKTVLNQALMRWSAHSWAALFAVAAMEARIYVNDILVSSAGWGYSVGGCITQGNTAGTNIGAHLINGRNKISFELARSWDAAASGVDAINVRFVAQYTGSPPSVSPPPSLSQQLLTYVKWGIVGAVVLGGVYVGSKAIAERRRKKT